MSILLVGSEGSMGKRYQAILRHIKKDFKCVDLLHDQSYVDMLAYQSDGIIIASPTNTHLSYIHRFSQMMKPVLCEKPLCKNLEELDHILSLAETDKFPLTMMMQYQWLISPSLKGESHYDYFRHGNDGLVWDCMQTIALAKGSISLKEESPIWKCSINGYPLNIAHMDDAYLQSVKGWLKSPKQDLKYLADIHVKVLDYEHRMSNVLTH